MRKEEKCVNDLVVFLKLGKTKEYKSKVWYGPLRSRFAALFAFLKRGLKFRDFCYLMLPFSMRPQEVNQLFSLYLDGELRSAITRFVENDTVVLFGKKFYLPPRNYKESIGFIDEIIAHDQYWVEEHVKQNSIVVDVGANLGTFAVYAAQKASLVYAFEPAKETFEYLEKNTASYPNIHIFNCGLGDKSELKEMMIYEGSTGGNAFIDSPTLEIWDKVENLHKGGLSKIITLDSINLPRVDFIKIDAEGYEAKIVEGARETIRKCKPVLEMSAYHHPDDKKLLPKLIKSIADYDFIIKKTYEEDLVFYPKKLS